MKFLRVTKETATATNPITIVWIEANPSVEAPLGAGAGAQYSALAIEAIKTTNIATAADLGAAILLC